MNPIQLIQIFQMFEEAIAVYNELKADGTIDQLLAAEQTFMSLANNEKVKDLLSKIPTIVKSLPVSQHVAGSTVNVAAQPPVAKEV